MLTSEGVNENDLEIVLFRSTRGGLVRVTRIAPAEGVLETWLAKAEDAEMVVLDRWSDVHARTLGYRPAWKPEPRGRRIPVEVVADL